MGETDAEIFAAMRLLQQGRADLPAGCDVTYELGDDRHLPVAAADSRADEAILAFYEDFHQRHGVRPTAVELYHSGYNPGSLRRAHGSWMQFLQTMGDLTAGERSVVESVGDFLDVVETTPMTKSFKMLTLLAMLNRDAFPGRSTSPI